MKTYDCIVAGEVCLDFPLYPIPLNSPLAEIGPIELEPFKPNGGGLVCNSGMVLAKLGAKTAAFGCIGNDRWSEILLELLSSGGVDTQHLIRLEMHSSATIVMVGDDGEHTFAYQPGASQLLDKNQVLDHLDLFAQTKFMLFGYYGLMRSLVTDLPTVLPQVKETGCQIAMDAAYGGGKLQPLDEILPWLDIYVPSYDEAFAQTNQREPQEMLKMFREYASSESLLGVKLGSKGALLSPSADSFLQIEPIEAPGPIMDTTGAGDSFYAGLIAGLAQSYEVDQAARIAAAAGACCVTGMGAISGIRDFKETAKIANV